MTRASEVLLASRAHCHRVARRARSSFYPSFALLSGEKRAAMEALYAFLRHTDDLADSPEPIDQRRCDLGLWREAVEAAIGGGRGTGDGGCGEGLEIGDWGLETYRRRATLQSQSPIPNPQSPIPALVAAVHRFHIPPEQLLAVIDGVQMDLDGRRYETFDELAQYCDRVASAVGLACIHIWGFRGPEAFEPARQCGRAFQLTNILRDLKEDTASGRVYLPAEDFRQCGYSVEELKRSVVNAGFYRLLDMEVARAREFYRQGIALMDWLEPAGHRVFGMMVSVYYRLLCEVERARERILAGRVRLSRWRRLLLAARWFLLPPRGLSIP